MKRPLPLLAASAWGAACGAALGALRTREAALHLLAKNRALEASGVLPLPGNGHWEAMVSWQPPAAGALFFGLSLGLGAGTLAGLWARASRSLPPRAGRVVAWLALALPAWALLVGDGGLAAVMAALALGALWSQTGEALPRREGLLRAAVLVPLLAGLAPWAAAPEGAFTRLRDRYLLEGPLGAAVDTFYYRWTLYPAEALKPLAALSQPTAWVSEATPPAEREAFCNQARRLGVLCVEDPSGADLEFSVSGGGPALLRGTAQHPWPPWTSGQEEAWRALSDASDPSRPLRRATALALLAGCPLALCWTLSSLALAAGASLWARRPAVPALGGSALLALALGAAGLPDPALAEVRARLDAPSPAPQAVRDALRSPSAVERFYGARAAGRTRVETGLLLEALSDRLINVRYAAAESLGRVDGPGSREALAEVVASTEEWYVKERAYGALWRLGWRPR